MTVKFTKIKGEPPAARRRGEHWYQVADACRSNPGTWYKVSDVAQGVSHAIRKGTYTAFREGTWEVRDHMRAVDGEHRKRVDLFVRYVGE